MGLFDNGFKMNTGLAIGLGVVVLLPIAAPLLAAVTKPLVKAGIKGGMILFQKGKEAIAEASEVLEDMVVEAQAELAKGPDVMSSVASAVAEKMPGNGS